MSATINIQDKQKQLAAENPFYGNQSLLSLAHSLGKGFASKSTLHVTLSNAWKLCKSKEEKELFFILLFNSGDIDRQHNIFRKAGLKNVDKGGHAHRQQFLWALQWLYKELPAQYYNFLPLIPEYTNWENIMYYQLRTDRKKGTILFTDNISTTKDFVEKTTDYLASVIQDPNTSPAEHSLIAKFLRKPRFSSRKRNPQSKKGGRRKLKPETIAKELFEFNLLSALSTKLGWEVKTYPTNTRFVGYEHYKAKHNRSSESYLFSSKEILNYDEDQFARWLEQLPSGARYNVQKRLLDKDRKSKGKWIGKYGDLAQFFINWEDSKTKASEEARKLEAKEVLTEEESAKLKTLQKQSKVNTGATTFIDLFKQILTGNDPTSINLAADNLLRQLKVEIPMLVVVDNSGSMNNKTLGNITSRISVAALAATIALLKNPSPDGKDILVKFNSLCEIMVTGQQHEAALPGRNRFMAGKTTTVETIVDRSDSFYNNYMRVRSLLATTGSTELTAFTSEVARWVKEVPAEESMRKEMINKFPVILIISDGDLNSHGSAMKSMAAAKHSLLQSCGWDGVMVLWDVKERSESHKFEFLDNVMHIPYLSAQTINQVFNNLSDVDIVDSYAPLKALHNSNRYDLVRSKVL